MKRSMAIPCSWSNFFYFIFIASYSVFGEVS